MPRVAGPSKGMYCLLCHAGYRRSISWITALSTRFAACCRARAMVSIDLDHWEQDQTSWTNGHPLLSWWATAISIRCSGATARSTFTIAPRRHDDVVVRALVHWALPIREPLRRSNCCFDSCCCGGRRHGCHRRSFCLFLSNHKNVDFFGSAKTRVGLQQRRNSRWPSVVTIPDNDTVLRID
jgi:hypothetical protein